MKKNPKQHTATVSVQGETVRTFCFDMHQTTFEKLYEKIIPISKSTKAHAYSRFESIQTSSR